MSSADRFFRIVVYKYRRYGSTKEKLLNAPTFIKIVVSVQNNPMTQDHFKAKENKLISVRVML